MSTQEIARMEEGAVSSKNDSGLCSSLEVVQILQKVHKCMPYKNLFTDLS